MATWLSDAQIKQRIIDAWATNPEKFAGYRITSLGSGNLSTRKIKYECGFGHVAESRYSHVIGTAPRKPAGCLQCFRRSEESTKQDVLRSWEADQYFLGYVFLRAYRTNSLRWIYQYKCKNGHIQEARFDPGAIRGCSRCPNRQALTPMEVEKRVKEHFERNRKIFEGYQLISSSAWQGYNTTIKCNAGHLSKVVARHIVKGNKTCEKFPCATKQSSGTSKYKTTTIDGKKFTFQGYEDRLLNILYKRGVAVKDVTTNADLHPQYRVSYTYNKVIRRYSPDVRVIINNVTRWYEVKCGYTYDLNGKSKTLREQNHSKWRATAVKTNEIFDSYIWETKIKDYYIIRYRPNGTSSTYRTQQEADNDDVATIFTGSFTQYTDEEEEEDDDDFVFDTFDDDDCFSGDDEPEDDNPEEQSTDDINENPVAVDDSDTDDSSPSVILPEEQEMYQSYRSYILEWEQRLEDFNDTH